MDKADAYLAQARSDFKTFEILWHMDEGAVPRCHALQHLQISTEKLAKAIFLYLGPTSRDAETLDALCPTCSRPIRRRPEYSHRAFSKIVQVIKRRDVIRKLGYTDDATRVKHVIESKRNWFREIEQLSPSIGTEADEGASNANNVEYPWQARDKDLQSVWLIPAEYSFSLSADLRHGDGPEFIILIRRLLERIPEAIA